jgi:hypothetical protein
MTLATKLILIAALVLSIFIPFGYYLLGEKNKGRYKCALAFNVLSYFGTFLVAGIMLFGSVPVHAADAAASGAGLATGLGYIAAALVTGLSCIGAEAVQNDGNHFIFIQTLPRTGSHEYANVCPQGGKYF